MDSAAWGEGRYRSCAGVKAWSVLLSYFCHSVAFQAYKCTHPITSLFIHPLIDTSVVSMSWLLLNNAAMNMEVKIYFWVRVLFRQIPRSGIKAMAPHSNTLAWKIPWMEEPGRLQSMGSLRVRYDWVTSLWLFTFMHWRRKWQPTPVFLPGESQGRGSLVGCRLWGHTELDTTEVT